MFDYLIVGAGFAGSVLAERLASIAGQRVLIVDRRPHTGGNAYDYYNDSGILIHKYGPHIFHTNSQLIFDYLSQFTEWRMYEHRVLASVDGMLLPFPINLDTVNRLYNLSLSSAEMEAFLFQLAEPMELVRNAEDQILRQIGRALYAKFFEGYTRKQWGIDPSLLHPSVTARIPVRTNRDDRYFTDLFQFMPSPSYHRLFQRMLDHPNIKVLLNTDFREIEGVIPFRHLIYTGAIDEYFQYRFGRLPYRSLRFEHELVPTAQFQPVAQVNFPQHQPFTRIVEHKHLTGQEHRFTTITYEFPTSDGDPYYPVPSPDAAELYQLYAQYAEANTDVIFAGRLGNYRYYNMDQVIGQALAIFKRLQDGARGWQAALAME